MAGKTFIARRGTTAVPNATIYGSFQGLATEDGGEPRRLSIPALGLLLLLLSRPQGKASMGYRAFLDRGMGKTTVMRALRELDHAGLRYQFKRRATEGAGVITDTVISECYLSPEEAQEIWASEGHKPLRKTGTSQEEPEDQEAEEEAPEDAVEPVDNPENANGPDSGATGIETPDLVVTISGALKSGAQLSGESSKDSLAPTSQESEGIQKAAGQRPAHGVDNGPGDDATLSPGRAAVLAMLEERRATRHGVPHGPSHLGAASGPGQTRTGSAGHLKAGGFNAFDYQSHVGQVTP
jgi:hypothetical protein